MPTAINTSTQTDSRAFYAEKRATANWQCYTYKKKKEKLHIKLHFQLVCNH